MPNYHILLILTLALLGCHQQPPSIHNLDRSALQQTGRYKELIKAYQNHIAQRLSVKNRPEWENPYLYFLDIGDIFLEQNQLEQALHYYHMAEEQGVKPAFVTDRLRHVARWYEERGDLHAALKHLQQHRERDPLLFDAMLDRLAREIIRQEDGPQSPQ